MLGPFAPAYIDRVHEVTETEPSEDARPAQVEVLAARVAHARTSLVWYWTRRGVRMSFL